MNHPPLQGMRLVLVTLALSLAVFMEVLDTTIANVAVPVRRSESVCVVGDRLCYYVVVVRHCA